MMQLICVGDVAISEGDMGDPELKSPSELIGNNEKFVIFNWELAAGDRINPSPRSSGSRYLSNPRAIEHLRSWAPGFTTLATNHILDAGEDGLANTLASLRQTGFQTLGAGMTRDEVNQTLFWETDGGVLAIINWVFPETHPDWMCIPGPNCWPGMDQAEETIIHLKQEADWVLAIVHWSDELFPYPRPEDRETAKALAKAGLDVLVGHHPHVVRGMEEIGNCLVFYSLGNYYFSDYKDAQNKWLLKWAPRSREGLGLKFTFKKGSIPEYELLSFWQTLGKVIDDPKRLAAKRTINNSRPLKLYSGDDYIKWYISKRRIFNQVGLRWHHGVRRLGLWGYLSTVVERV